MAIDFGKVQVEKKVGNLKVEDGIIHWDFRMMGRKDSLIFPVSDIQEITKPFVFTGKVPVKLKVRLLGDVVFLFTGYKPKPRAEEFLNNISVNA